MIHKIWEKDLNAKETIASISGEKVVEISARNIRDHLAKCYQDVYLSRFPSLGYDEDCEYAANNFIK